MLVDTHCHINMMVKKEFDVPLKPEQMPLARDIARAATESGVTQLVNVGTSLIESRNCVALAQSNEQIVATIGIHPNDCSQDWQADLRALATLLKNRQSNKIVGIGECGLDRHYPDHNLPRQRDAFKAQIELALEHDLPIVVHTREAGEETLKSLEEYAKQARAVIHCFSEELAFAQTVIDWGFMVGIGGTITYPKNDSLRGVAKTIPLQSIILETDAPFLPIQKMRGQRNHPRHIADIARYLAELRTVSFEDVATQTTRNAQALFGI